MAKAKKGEEKKIQDTSGATGKEQALKLALEQIEKQFGTGSVMKLGDDHKANIETFPTGSISLDMALGGGLPKAESLKFTAQKAPVKLP